MGTAQRKRLQYLLAVRVADVDVLDEGGDVLLDAAPLHFEEQRLQAARGCRIAGEVRVGLVELTVPAGPLRRQQAHRGVGRPPRQAGGQVPSHGGKVVCRQRLLGGGLVPIEAQQAHALPDGDCQQRQQRRGHRGPAAGADRKAKPVAQLHAHGHSGL